MLRRSSALRLGPGFAGRKPANRNGPSEMPDAERVVTAAFGPGIGTTLNPAARAFLYARDLRSEGDGRQKSGRRRIQGGPDSGAERRGHRPFGIGHLRRAVSVRGFSSGKTRPEAQGA